MAVTKRAQVVSVTTLAKAIDQAVALAAKRQEVKFEPANLSLNWEIIGRQIRDARDFNTAMKVATDITKSIKVDGIKGQPVVSKLPGGILVGFIDRGLVPRQLG